MRLFYRILISFIFLAVLLGIIAFARGYRLDLERQSLTPTGIIAVSAYPKASKVFVNGELRGVSDINLTLPPGYYEVEVKKDGFTGWSKNVTLKGELVLTLDVLLYPLNPSLSPLTNLSINRGIPIAQSDRMFLISENDDEEKDGVYLFETSKTPISFFAPLKLVVLKKSLVDRMGTINLKDIAVVVSPDVKEAIFTFETSAGEISYLISLEGSVKQTAESITSPVEPRFFDVTSSKATLIEAWTRQKEEVKQKILESYPKEFVKVASDSFSLIDFSPDETKLLYQPRKPAFLTQAISPPLIATNQTPEVRQLEANSLYVYDKKEDRNYKIDPINLIDLIPDKNSLGQSDQLEIRQPDGQVENYITWYSDSKHLVVNQGQKISILDYDGQNQQTVYSGQFESDFFKLTSDGRILILTNLNPEANKYPDLYAVGIR